MSKFISVLKHICPVVLAFAIMALYVFPSPVSAFTALAEDTTPVEPTFRYTVQADGTAHIIGAGNITADFVIPETVDGYTVSTIGDYAFCDVSIIQTLTLPDSIRTLEEWCFSGCQNLTSVHLPEGLKVMESDCFSRTGLTSVVLPNSLISMSNGNFSRCYDLASVTLPKGLTWLDEGIFWENNSLKSIVIPNSVAEIYENCFIYSGLESVTIPASVKQMDTSTFEECGSLKTLYTTEGSYAETFFKANYPSVAVEYLTAEGTLVESIDISLPENTVPAIGEAIALNVSILPETAANKDLIWTIGDSDIANITSEGVLTFNGHGTVTVKAISEDLNCTIGSLNVTCESTGDYNYTLKNGAISINGYKGSDTDLVIPDTIDGYTVIGIESYAFNGNSSIESVVIPDSVTFISSYAFQNCTSLSSFTIGKNVKMLSSYMLSGCTSLGSLVVPDNVEAIDENFAHGSGIMEITLPPEVELYWDSFAGMYLTKVRLYANTLAHNHFVYSYSEYNENDPPEIEFITLSDLSYSVSDGSATITGVGSSADVTILAIPETIDGNTVTAIGDGAFKDNTSITKVVLPSSLVSIGNEAFMGCTGLTNIIGTQNNLQSIGSSAFMGCTGLADINLYSLQTIGDYAFKNCTSLTILNCFNATYIGKEAFMGCSKLYSMSSYKLTSFGEGAFRDCTALRAFSFTENLTAIPANAFNGCTGFKSIDMIYDVDSVGENAFAGCTSLTNVYAPKDGTIWNYFKTNHADVILTDAAPAPSYVETQVDGNGNMTITGWNNPPKNISLPALMMGRPLVHVGGTLAESDVESIVFPDTVTSIGANEGSSFFEFCRDLKSVTLPAGLTSINGWTFLGCNSLTSITLPDALQTIGDCAFEGSGLTTVMIPGNVTSIGEYAFGSTKLESIVIPASVTKIEPDICDNTPIKTLYTTTGSYAAEYFTNNYPDVEIVYMSGDASGITYEIADGEVTITGVTSSDAVFNVPTTIEGKPVTKIGSGAFKGNTVIKTVFLGNSVTAIGDSAFENSAVTAVNFGSGLTSIGNSAFAGSPITSAALPANVTSLGDNAFAGCTALSSAAISSGLTSIGSEVFSGCTSLKNIDIPENIASIGAKAFANSAITTVSITEKTTAIADDAFSGCSLVKITAKEGSFACDYFKANFPNAAILTDFDFIIKNGEAIITGPLGEPVDLVIPASLGGYPVTTVAYDAFYDCGSLKSLVLPGSIRKLESWCFSNCVNLTSVVLPEGLEIMESDCFSDTALTSVVLPDSLRSMSNGNFSRCYDLASVTLPNGITWLDEGIFWENNSLKSIVIPNSVTEIYDNCFIYSGLESVTIPASVKQMETSTFEECGSLKTLYTTEGSYAETFFKANYPSVAVEYLTSEDILVESITVTSSVGTTATKGTAIQLTAEILPLNAYNQNVTWSISDANIASLTTDGVLTFKRSGTVTVTATAKDLGGVKGTITIECPMTDILVLPDQIIGIEEEAFLNNTFESVVLPDGLEFIGRRAFAGCYKLVHIEIPSSVTSIGADAFSGCDDVVLTIPPIDWMEEYCWEYGLDYVIKE